jgi:DHA1 family multidrug resistance protein-like MFS transporter
MFSASSLLEVAAWGHMDAFLPLFIERELGLSDAEVPFWTGILAGAPMFLAVPLSPFWGVLADRYSRKLIILRVQVAATIAYGLAALTTDVSQLLGARLLLGLSFGSNAIIVAILAAAVPDRRLGLAIGLLQMMLPLGKALGPLLGSGLINLFGLRGMFAADAAMAFASLLVVLLLYHEAPRRHDTSRGVFRHLGEVMRVVWQRPALRYTFFISALFAGGNWMLTPYLPILIDRVYEGPDVEVVIGLVLGAYGGLAALAAPLAGRLIDRLGADRVLAFNMAGLMLMSGGLVFADTPVQVGAMVLLGAMPFGATNTAIYTHLARHTPPEHTGAVMGLTPMARNSAMLLGPMLGAAVSGLGLRAVFATAVVVHVVAVACAGALQRTSRGAFREEKGK